VKSLLHPSKLTWNLKITQLKRKIIFQTTIFGFHITVNFQGVQFFQGNWGNGTSLQKECFTMFLGKL